MAILFKMRRYLTKIMCKVSPESLGERMFCAHMLDVARVFGRAFFYARCCKRHLPYAYNIHRHTPNKIIFHLFDVPEKFLDILFS